MQSACATLSSVVCLVLQYFFANVIYLIKGAIFGRRKNLLNIKCVLIFSANLSKIFLMLKRIQQDTTINVGRSLCKIPVILIRF
jgi:hypothetical protein